MRTLEGHIKSVLDQMSPGPWALTGSPIMAHEIMESVLRPLGVELLRVYKKIDSEWGDGSRDGWLDFATVLEPHVIEWLKSLDDSPIEDYGDD